MNKTDTFNKGPKGHQQQSKNRSHYKEGARDNDEKGRDKPWHDNASKGRDAKGGPRREGGPGKDRPDRKNSSRFERDDRGSGDTKPFDKKPFDRKPGGRSFNKRDQDQRPSFDRNKGAKGSAPRRTEDFEPVIYSDDPKGIAVRRAAADILTLVKDGLSLDEALSQCRSYEGLGRTAEGDKEPSITRADKGFARAIATTVLRQKGTLDHLISPYLNRPLPAKSYRAMDFLRIAGAQTLFLKTPAHAAVSLSTELCKERKETAGYANLVNAVARKLSQTDKDKIEALPARTNTPAWLWRTWERAYGPVNTRQIAKAHEKQAPLDITFAKKLDRDVLLGDIDSELEATIFEYNDRLNGLRLKNAPSNITKLPGFEDGKWWVQDIAASLPVALLGELDGKQVIDLCAAPGGKTLQLAASGAKVTAIDRSDERLQRLRRNLERTNLTAEIVSGDAFDFRPEHLADIVLLDAPCSATGTIRRHPDIPWNKTQTDIDALIRVQSDMIDHALTMLKPGGILLYCTCSMQPEEGEKQIINALHRKDNLERQPFSATTDPLLAGAFEKAINKEGDLRLLPSLAADDGGMDGFFISRLCKKS